MTMEFIKNNAEAIKQIQNILDWTKTHDYVEIDACHEEALQMAIKALEEQEQIGQSAAEIAKLLDNGYFKTSREELADDSEADIYGLIQYTMEFLNGEREGISASEMMAMGDALAEGFREGLQEGEESIMGMTNKEAKRIMEIERTCVLRQDTPECGRDEYGCGACDLVQSSDDVIEAYGVAIKALEQEPCDKCVYSTKDGCCQYDDITETIPPFKPQESEDKG